MNWRPIAEYDAMKKKPKNVVFLIAQGKDTRGKPRLSRGVVTERYYGFRTTTHFIELPEFPEE